MSHRPVAGKEHAGLLISDQLWLARSVHHPQCRILRRRREMDKALHGKRYAILADNGFEESELIEPLKALQDLGTTVEVVSPQT